MKKLLLLIAMLCCLQATAAKKGDVNGDNTVNVSDVSVIINKILGVADASNTDVNGDGMTNVSDVSFIINIILGNDIADDTHEYVDLGLPSGTLWATCNVGAERPSSFGLYFAWGETKGYANGETHDFFLENYKWMTPGKSSSYYFTKYTYADNITSGHWYDGDTYVGTTVNGVTYKNLKELLPEDDAATVNWGTEWRMPSGEEIEELIDERYTKNRWDLCDGIYGCWIESLSNGNQIFLPAGDMRWFADMVYNDNSNSGFYMTRELFLNSISNRNLRVSEDQVTAVSAVDRNYGRNVRAVRVKKAKR